MKFARYLQENQTPEWKKAYIDYHGLKKKIKAAAKPNHSGRYRDDSDNDSEGDDETFTRDVRDRADSPGGDLGEATLLMQRGEGDEVAQEDGDRRSSDGLHVDQARSSTASGESHEALLGRTAVARRGSRPDGWEEGEREGDDHPAFADDRESPDAPPSQQSLQRPSQSAHNPSVTYRPTTATASSSRSRSDSSPSPSSSPLPTSSSHSTTSHIPPNPSTSSSAFREASTSRSPRPESSTPPQSDGRKPRASRPKCKEHPVSSFLGSSLPRSGALMQKGRDAMRKGSPAAEASLKEILATLLPLEQEFVSALDVELDKVEDFYKDREKEMRVKVRALQKQAKELVHHRTVYRRYESQNPHRPSNSDHPPPKGFHLPNLNLATHATEHLRSVKFSLLPSHLEDPARPSPTRQRSPTGEKGSSLHHEKGKDPSDPTDQMFDPSAYKRYKRRLRAATLECYRGLEILKNFRVLNLTGCKKALKKFEKASQVRIMEPYTSDRISHQTFADASTLDALIEEVENLYAARFEHGNKKNAKERLRVSANLVKTHHASVFRAGVWIGLSLFPFVHAIVLSFQHSTRVAIPAWKALLQVFGALYLVVVFALAFSINLWVWAKYRVNYKFVFELNPHTVIDYRQYAELLSFLLFSLSGCLWLAFARVGTSNVASTTWPLAWIVFAILVVINPLPTCHRTTRYWFIRCFFKVFTPFWSQVGFASFFLADELNSLVYSASNLWFLGCAQNRGWQGDVYGHCNRYGNWVSALLSCIAPFARLLQCIQRWRESGKGLHLINAGKYASVIATYIAFFFWRHRGATIHDRSFPIWATIASLNSIYTCSWDLLVDWSLMRPDQKFLRKETVYSGKEAYLYFAIVSNIILRCMWVGYLPRIDIDLNLRGFIFACLEVIRRWQWNFLRVENEHLGNADTYRVTRELPLPYELHDGDSSDEEERPNRPAAGKRMSISRTISTNASARLRWRRMVSVSKRSSSGARKIGDEEKAVVEKR